MFLKAGAHKFELVDFCYNKLVMDNWIVNSNGDNYRPLLSEFMDSQIIDVNAEFWVFNFSRSNLRVSFRRLILKSKQVLNYYYEKIPFTLPVYYGCQLDVCVDLFRIILIRMENLKFIPRIKIILPLIP